MPLVFLKNENEEWYVLSKDEKLRKKGFACFYDHLTNEPVVVLSHDNDMRLSLIHISEPTRPY